jgi:hypothetical protein
MEGTFHSFGANTLPEKASMRSDNYSRKRTVETQKNGLDYFIKLLIDMRNKLA